MKKSLLDKISVKDPVQLTPYIIPISFKDDDHCPSKMEKSLLNNDSSCFLYSHGDRHHQKLRIMTTFVCDNVVDFGNFCYEYETEIHCSCELLLSPIHKLS